MPPIITLLTDFGDTDGYVGAMKGVMLHIIPTAALVDISHHVQPQNLRQTARIIAQTAPYYPPETVHLIVVDPGVGSDRKPIAVQSRLGRFVAPDNGVLTPIYKAAPTFSAVVVSNTAYWREEAPSQTFHGRDIFSPAAAHLAAGVRLEELGPPLDNPVQISIPQWSQQAGQIEGEIVHIDHFGNAITNIAPLHWQPDGTLMLNDAPLPTEELHITCKSHTFRQIRTQYSTVEPGEALVLVGSRGELEFAVNQGDAANQLGLSTGDRVLIRY